MWRRHRYEEVGDSVEDLAHASPFHPVSFALWGIVAPLILAYLAARSWIDEAATLLGNDEVELTGDAAKAMAVSVLSVALFLHVRFVWGALGFYRTHQVVTIVACFGFIASVLMAIVFGLGGR